MHIGKMEIVPLRQAFQHEAQDFTRWLDQWPALQDRLIDAMIRFDKALRPRIAKLTT